MPKRGRLVAFAATLALLVAITWAIWWLLAHDAGSRGNWLGDKAKPFFESAKGPPSAPQLAYKPLTSGEAEAENKDIPFASAPIETALPLFFSAPDKAFAGRRAAIDCMAAAVYYEGASESTVGRRGIAQVILNRVRHPAFANSICGVVYEGSQRSSGCQFSFTCDGSLNRRPDRKGWEAARVIAESALSGGVEPTVGMATHYHADYVVPYWARSLDKITKIGAHIFYRWRGNWGKRAAFTQAIVLDDLGLINTHLTGLNGVGAGTEIILEGMQPIILAEPAIKADAAAGKLISPPPAELSSSAQKRMTGSSVLKADRIKGSLTVDESASALKDD